jgi:hypothetical protein
MSQDHDNDLECVRALQNALFILGEAVAVDGSFGPETAEAVRRFQSSEGLDADGVAGSSTLTALESALPGDKVFITGSGVFSCGDLFGTCTFYFDHPTTHKISRALDGAVGITFACPRLKDFRAAVACGLLGALGTQAVREAASTAVRGNACLAVDLGAVHVYSDDGKYCRR